MQGAPTRTLPAIDWVSPPSGWPTLICPPTTGVSISENIKQQFIIVDNEHQNSSTLSFISFPVDQRFLHDRQTSFLACCFHKNLLVQEKHLALGWGGAQIRLDLGSCSVPCGVYHCPSLQVSSSFHVIRFPCLAPETHPSSQIETECGLFMFTPKKISKE